MFVPRAHLGTTAGTPDSSGRANEPHGPLPDKSGVPADDPFAVCGGVKMRPSRRPPPKSFDAGGVDM